MYYLLLLPIFYLLYILYRIYRSKNYIAIPVLAKDYNTDFHNCEKCAIATAVSRHFHTHVEEYISKVIVFAKNSYYRINSTTYYHKRFEFKHFEKDKEKIAKMKIYDPNKVIRTIYLKIPK